MGASMNAMGESSSPVLSLTVLDARTLPEGILRPDSLLLVVVRRPDCNPTHPNVVSVPTQRLPRSLFCELLHGARELSGEMHSSRYAGNDVDSAAGHSIASLLDANLPRQPLVASSRVARAGSRSG